MVSPHLAVLTAGSTGSRRWGQAGVVGRHLTLAIVAFGRPGLVVGVSAAAQAGQEHPEKR